ncbi:MAG TPA: FtsX-like permease family protein [Gemmatimonadaceae bacterium]|nr:FtsX-like permease family protein [Gemmatimonadaceae bacterium]
MVIRALHRKLLRDLWRLRGQVASIAAVVACGIATVVALNGTEHAVSAAQHDYYARYHFAHVFASARRVPEPELARIAALPGVARAESRVVIDVALDVPGLDLPARGRLVSLPDDPRGMLDGVHLAAGRMVRPGSTSEVVVGSGFAAANGIAIGDSLGAVLEGRWRRLHVVGLGMSPEFVYELAAAGGFDMDERAFGILWMSRRALAAGAGMRGAFNDVALRLVPGASERAVRATLDSLLAPYGGHGAIGREQQPSHRMLIDEFRQLRVFGVAVPTIFLLVACFLLNVVLSRLIATQRPEIAALKSFGYLDREVGLHYVAFAAVAVLLGAIVGIVVGVWIGGGYTELYGRFFRFPDLRYRPDVATAVVAVAASGAAALLGALSAARAAMRLPPAEALRPESPERYRPLLLEHLGFGHLLTPSWRMILRSIERHPWRAASAVLGSALALGLIAGTFSVFDGVYRLMELQFRDGMREDVSVTFHSARPALAAERELARIPSVSLAEAYRAVPARVRHGGRVRSVAVVGLARGSALHRLVDARGARSPVPVDGIVLSERLAETIDARRGDTLRLELVERGGAPRRVVVAGVFSELIGVNLYMDRAALDRVVGDPPLATGAYLRVEPARQAGVLAALKRLPAVAGAASRGAMLAAFDRQMTESIRMSGGIIATIAAVLAIGVVYNGARIALSERGRELASLRVLGFSRREIAVMLFGEQALLVGAAIPLGALFGVALNVYIMRAFASEEHRFPQVTDAVTYLQATAVLVAAAMAAGLLMRRRLDRMDLIAVLKTRE